MSHLDFIIQTSPWLNNPSFRFPVLMREQYQLGSTYPQDRLIRILLGARRVGKTSILQSHINSLLDKNSKFKIFFIPADLPEVKSQGIRVIIDQLAQELNLNIFQEKIYFFIDEIQEVSGWQNDLKLLYDHTQLNFFVTGSSSLLLKQETSKLTGRYLLRYILPLSFSEFRLFSKKFKKPHSLVDFLQIGGYPEYVINRNPQYLQQAVESTLYRELLDLYGIRNPVVLTNILRFLADKLTTPLSANRIAKDLNIDGKTAGFYLDYLQSVYLIYPVFKYGRSNKLSKSSLPKYYFNDTGIISLYGIRQRGGRLYENAVFLHLLRQHSTSEVSPIFYDNVDQTEIDFRVKQDWFKVKANDVNPETATLLSDLNLNKINVLVKKIPDRDCLRHNLEFIELETFLAS